MSCKVGMCGGKRKINYIFKIYCYDHAYFQLFKKCKTSHQTEKHASGFFDRNKVMCWVILSN